MMIQEISSHNQSMILIPQMEERWHRRRIEVSKKKEQLMEGTSMEPKEDVFKRT